MNLQVETSAKYETGQLGSGTYLITNVRAQIHAVPARDKSVVGDVRPDKDHETGLLRNMLWRVNALKNGKFAIQAVTGDTVLYAICDVDPEFGDEITTSTTGQQWIIKKTDRKGHYVYVISFHVTRQQITITLTPCLVQDPAHHFPELTWGLRRDDVLTKITLREVYSEPRHQWQFQSVEVPPPPFCESDIVEDDKTSYSRFNDAEDGGSLQLGN
ncbi:hypothetical protein BD410DRAFT_845188 [Rickenella mellea]|uniref:Ricin B lectin domain-containing protein n=1 Tax=Rickenella mellea TaxID=50990 RepID=A0A4Y7PLK2_9AGAM|nr:hypothetical protein BD410DRAFT_845188 [Rickenella mellea]